MYPLGNVVRVRRGGQAGADIDELPYAGGRHVTDGAAKEVTVFSGHLG